MFDGNRNTADFSNASTDGVAVLRSIETASRDDRIRIRPVATKKQAVEMGDCVCHEENKKCDEHPAFSLYYRTIMLIGRGSFGIVNLCVHRRTEIQCAVKILKTKGISTNRLIRHYREERILRQLSHQHIATYHESIWGPNQKYLVFEYLRGGQLLEDIRRKGCYSERDASVCMEQILNAVQYFHGKDIVHRDLKLDNVMLASTFPGIFVKVIDFGLAMSIKEIREKNTCIVPISDFTAPEVANKQPQGKPMDIYSCGLILYRLLVGLVPNMPVIGEDYPEEFGKISFAAADLVKFMLEPIPGLRMPAENALKHEFITNRGQDTSTDEDE